MKERFTITRAAADDSDAILKLYEEEDAPGNPSIIFTRRNNAFLSMQQEGEDVLILLCKEVSTGKLAGMGACSINMCNVNGVPRPVAYLFAFKISSTFRYRVGRMIIGIYEHFRTFLDDKKIDCVITTILAKNSAAHRLLARPHTGKPDYHFIGTCEFFALKTDRKPKIRPRSDVTITTANRCSREQLMAFINKETPLMNFSPVIHKSAALPSDFFEQCLVVSDAKSGAILATGYCWDQRPFKQYIATAYHGIYRLASRWSGLLPLFGYPPLPVPGAVMNFASLSYVIVRDQRTDYFRLLLDAASAHCAAYDFMMIGIGPHHPHRRLLCSSPHWNYSSDIYAVSWNKDAVPSFGLPTYLECGRL